jgi:hypothetical protein
MRKLLTVGVLAVALSTISVYGSNSPDIENLNGLKKPLVYSTGGAVGMILTDYGILYYCAGGYFDYYYPEDPSLAEATSIDNPAYPLVGALWIGAEVEDTSNKMAWDTLVSVSEDCLNTRVHELQLADELGLPRHSDLLLADHQFRISFSDEIGDLSKIKSDPIDERMHIPLGIKITQENLFWETSGYDDFIIVKYYIENERKLSLRNLWIGILSGRDIDNPINDKLNIFADPGSLCGYFQYNNYEVVWSSAGEHEENPPDNGANRPKKIIGVVFLGSSDEMVRTNFNWWAKSDDASADWGPQYQGNCDIGGDFPEGLKGTPGGDKAKYRLMSNGEIDYDQAFYGMDWTSNGWIEKPNDIADDIADGAASDFLISFGPFNIDENKAETLMIAVVAGHVFDSDAEKYLKRHAGDSLAIERFYGKLDFSEFTSAIDTVIRYDEMGFENIPIGPPPNFQVDSWDSNHIELNWAKISHLYLNGYNIYRGTAPGDYERLPIAFGNYDDTCFIDSDVADNTIYYYAITSVNIFGIQGGYSNELVINTGQPHTPEGLSVIGGNGNAVLSWNPNADNDLLGYVVFRKSSIDEEYVTVDTISTIGYSDYSLFNGVIYFYKIQAIDIYGNNSFCSDSVKVIPMAFDSGIMLINANSDDAEINPDYDSMARFYENLIGEYLHVIAYECPDNLNQLSPYSTIIWCKDKPQGRIEINQPDYTTLLSDYLDAGGNLILIGNRLIGPDSGAVELTFEQGDFRYDYLNLDGIKYLEEANTEFIGGWPCMGRFPEFHMNITKGQSVLTPQSDHNNGLSGIGCILPWDTSEVLYKFIAANPDTSLLHDMPIAIMHETDRYKAAVIEFPLFYINEVSASEIIHEILGEFGEKMAVQDVFQTVPESIELLQNFPNPFNFRTEIRYNLPRDCHVTLEIFDILGRAIITLVDEYQAEGENSVTWDGRNASGMPSTSGIYFYRLTTPGEVTARRMVYLK